MKALFKLLLTIIIIAAAAGPYFTGKMVEKKYEEFIAQLNITNKGQATIIGKFYRGFFSSTATTQISFIDSYQTLQLSHHIKHGPIIIDFAGWTKLNSYIPQGLALAVVNTTLLGEAQQVIENAYAGKPAYDITTKISLKGDINTDIISHPLTYQNENATLIWQGAKATIFTSEKLQDMKVVASFPSIEYVEQKNTDKQSIRLMNINADYETKFDTFDAALKFSLGNMKIAHNDVAEFNMDKYEATIDRKTTNNLMNMLCSFKFDKLSLGKNEFGQFNFTLNIKNLHAESMRVILRQPATVEYKNAQMITETFLVVLNNKFNLDMNLDMNTPDGKFIIKGNADIGGPEVKTLSPEQITPTINANAEAQISSKLFQTLMTKFAEDQIHEMEALYFMANKTSSVANPYTMTPEVMQSTISTWLGGLITKLVTQKYLVQSDDMLSTKISYAQDALTINDVPKTSVDLDSLQAMFIVVTPPELTAAPSTTDAATDMTAPAATPAPTTPDVPAAPTSTISTEPTTQAPAKAVTAE